MKIIAFGDIHMEYGALQAVSGLAGADMVIVTGDLTNFGNHEAAHQVISAIRDINPNIYAQPGNLDDVSVMTYLNELGINLHGRGFLFEDVGVFGVGGSNPTPFNTPTEFSEDEIGLLLEQGHATVSHARIKIMVSHAPPYDTAADRISNGMHVGSKAVREFIERIQPDFCLTGHIHEARSLDRIGRTVIINPGMLGKGGWIELQNESGAWSAFLRP
ncbi:MAG: metallophosphoesterase [Dissulfuribacterales bacterium]